MLRRTLLVTPIFLLFAPPAAAQGIDAAEGVAGLTEVPPPSARVCPRSDAPDASCHVAHAAQRDAPYARNEPEPAAERVPEPADWTVWLCGIAIAGVIAVRRLRGGGLTE
jgi:hypothetical protein